MANKKTVETKKKERIKKKSVVFVCTGNTCRSPMAEYILKFILKNMGKLTEYNVLSAGIYAVDGEMMAENSKLALKEMGIISRKRPSKQLSEEMLNKADLVVCMTNEHKETFIECDKIKSIGEITGAGDVLDPYGQSLDSYKKVAAYLNYAMPEVLVAIDNVVKPLNNTPKKD